MNKIRLDKIINNQKEFQRAVGFPIDSVSETVRNELSERYIFKLIEEAVELRKEFPSSINPWSKKQKPADLTRVKEEFSDVLLFLINISIVWKLDPETILSILESVQRNNFDSLKLKKMEILNTDILKIPNTVSGIGSGNLSPEWVFVGQNPGKGITQGYKFWSNPEDGSSKILLPALDKIGITRDSCYFTNVVKCITLENLEPSEDLTNFYKEFLNQELEILRLGNPHMKVVTLGKWAEDNCSHDAALKHPATVLYGGMSQDEYEAHVDSVLTKLE